MITLLLWKITVVFIDMVDNVSLRQCVTSPAGRGSCASCPATMLLAVCWQGPDIPVLLMTDFPFMIRQQTSSSASFTLQVPWSYYFPSLVIFWVSAFSGRWQWQRRWGSVGMMISSEGRAFIGYRSVRATNEHLCSVCGVYLVDL